MKYLNRFFVSLAMLGVMFFSASCSSDSDVDSYANLNLKAQFSSEPSGISSFDEEARVLVVNEDGVTTSAITLSDVQGIDVSKLTFKTSVPADDHVWCLANCSKNRLSLSVAKNATETPRQTLVDITAWDGDRLVNTFTMMVLQTPKKVEVVKQVPTIKAFLIPNQVSSTIDMEAGVITVAMPYGTDASALKPTIVLSAGATVEPNSEVVQDFKNNVVKYTVTGPDGGINVYYVVVTVKEPSTGGGGTGGGTTEEVDGFRTFDMVDVPAGSFIIGEDLGTGYKKENAHKVNISAFKMGKYLVTQREYKQIMGYNPALEYTSNDLYPVNNVTWFEACMYCNKLSELEGLTPVYTFTGTTYQGKELLDATGITINRNANGYRLPTSAEWEYAAKGGPNQDPYTYPGSNGCDEVCWYAETSKINNVPALHLVGQKKPNSLGLYDMVGNLYVYTTEWYSTYKYLTDAEETDPWGLPEPRDENKYVIVRGSDYRKPYKVSIIDSNMLTAFMKTDTDEYGGRLWLKTIGFRVILPRK